MEKQPWRYSEAYEHESSRTAAAALLIAASVASNWIILAATGDREAEASGRQIEESTVTYYDTPADILRRRIAGKLESVDDILCVEYVAGMVTPYGAAPSKRPDHYKVSGINTAGNPATGYINPGTDMAGTVSSGVPEC